MDYIKHYEKLINRARLRSSVVYVESHHIIPRCFGGSDEKTNLVDLTPEEHYVAHLLLVKIHNYHPKLVHAATMMCVRSKTHGDLGRNNKLYGWLRRRLQISAKERCGTKNGSFGKPWFCNPATSECMKYIPGTEPIGWVRGRTYKEHKCIVCGENTDTKLQKYCNRCRPKIPKTVFKSEKVKSQYTDEEKINALNACDGNIRRALYRLGLNDSGSNYKKMRILKEVVYPYATNVLKD